MATQAEQIASNPVSGLRAALDAADATHLAVRDAGWRHRVRLPPGARSLLREHIVGAADCLAVGVATASVIRFLGEGGTPTRTLAAVLSVALYHAGGGHHRGNARFTHTTLDEFPAILVLAGIVALILTIVTPTAGNRTLGGERTAILWMALTFSIAAGRIAARFVRARAAGPERCLVVGTVTEARRIQRRLRASGVNAQIIGAVGLAQLGPSLGPEELHEAVTTVAEDVQADRLIVSLVDQSQEDIAGLVRVARLAGLGLSVCSPLLDAAATSAGLSHVTGMGLLAADPIDNSRQVVRRAVDIAFAGTLLLALSPLLAVIAAAIKFDAPGPVFFRQTRVGKGGRHFRIFKFRSMVADAEGRKASLRMLSEVGSEMFKLTDDPRVTRVGRILRRSSLDELPQLLNVLLGDMTLVGPRPLVVDEDAVISGVGRARLQRTPGMTGPWQVLRERVAQPEMLEVDYSYVTNSTLWVDLKILVQTILHVLRRANV